MFLLTSELLDDSNVFLNIHDVYCVYNKDLLSTEYRKLK